MTLVAEIDSATRSAMASVCDADAGAVVRGGRARHPHGTEIGPAAWESAAGAQRRTSSAPAACRV